MNLRYVGMLRGTAGWARVGRGIVGAFLDLGHRVTVTEVAGPGHDPAFPLDPRLAELLARRPADRFLERLASRGDSDATIAYTHPSAWAKLPGRVKVGILEYDTSHLPRAWAEATAALDLVVVPSEFCRGIVLGAGVPAGKIAVVPFGHDPRVCHPGGPGPIRPLTFLHVAGSQARKATPTVVQAFADAFPGADDARLVIKTTAHAAANRAAPSPRPPGDGAPARAAVDLFARGDARVTVIEEAWPDARMGDLFRSADVLVQPSRADGFSLAVLEAMACGVPVIATYWGGVQELCAPANSLAILYRLVPAMDLQYDLDGDPGWPLGVAADPDADHVADAMRLAHDRRDLAIAKGEAARAAARALTWEATARGILDAIARRGGGGPR
jgi:glycosyltransferase involved in cell wall biosynthesis